MDLTTALVIVSSALSGTQSPAPDFLVDEVERRSGVRWETGAAPADTAGPFVWLGTEADLVSPPGWLDTPPPETGRPLGPEGFRLVIRQGGGHAQVLVIGHDPQGALYGAGRLLRTLEMTAGRVVAPAALDLSTTPAYPLRGHQLGYRDTPNSYDAWDLDQWEQYYRDLIVFGANAVELVSPNSNGKRPSPHFPRPMVEMMTGMSALADKYGLDLWIWYPAIGGDYADPAVRAAHLREAERIFRELPRVDHVFVPGGDPGSTEPSVLMPFLKEMAAVLQRRHPEAKLWVSPQGFGPDWMRTFVRQLDEGPDWLGGVVYGPGVPVPLARFREMIPARYPVRSYPDITHTFHCQYPVPSWDRAFALTEGREPVNPRPADQSLIFNHERDHVTGWLTYSEGAADDVNKAVWSALAWDPDAHLEDILEDYARCFIGPEVAVPFARGLLGLEENWRGPLATNENVPATLRAFRAMERANPRLAGNWRWEMALYRACYDAFVRLRLARETQVEAAATAILAEAAARGSAGAMDAAERLLAGSTAGAEEAALRARVHELGESLFRHIGLQLSVGKYGAAGLSRGANLDTIDFPLNNSRWLRAQFAAVRTLPGEAERLRRIEAIAAWTDPGPGGFYDDLGDSTREPHLVRGAGYASDPGFLVSVADDFELVKELPFYEEHPYRYSWLARASALHGTPVRLRYKGLDPRATYRVRVVYPADRDDFVPKIRLTTDDGFEIHPFIDRPIPAEPVEFAVPRQATSDGELGLELNREPIVRGNGRGAQIAEIWLLKDSLNAKHSEFK